MKGRVARSWKGARVVVREELRFGSGSEVEMRFTAQATGGVDRVEVVVLGSGWSPQLRCLAQVELKP